MEEIGKGAIVKNKFKNIFKDFMGGFKCSDDYDNEFIKNSIRSHMGDQISGFPSMECFRSLLVPQLAKLKEPTYNVLDEVYQELLELSGELNSKVFSRFPDLMNIVGDVSVKKIQELKDQT